MKRKRPGGLSFYIILIVIIMAMSLFMQEMVKPRQITLSELEADIRNGHVESVLLRGSELEVTTKGTSLKPAQTYSKDINSFMISSYYELLKEAKDEGLIESLTISVRRTSREFSTEF